MGLFDGLSASDAERDAPDEATLAARTKAAIEAAKRRPARQIGDEMFTDEDE